MSPQPKKGDAVAEGGDIVERLLDQAATLADEKSELFGRIDANRKALRNLADTGLLSADQRGSVDEFYPRVQRARNGGGTKTEG